MNKKEYITEYFNNETSGLTITNIKLIETKYSYLFSVSCYLIESKDTQTDTKCDFYLFYSDSLPMNLYPIQGKETLDEYYYKHIGLMYELCSATVSNEFITSFLDKFSIFPIIERKMLDIAKDISPSKTSTQLKGIANQLRDCYIELTNYLMNQARTENPDFKNDNFSDNYQEFVNRVLPGSQSEKRRNVLNTIATKGWSYNSELVHKDSITLYDIFISFNILQLIVSNTSNLLVGNQMPFNSIKCPNCKGEHLSMRQDRNTKEFIYICNDCKTKFNKNMEDIVS